MQIGHLSQVAVTKMMTDNCLWDGDGGGGGGMRKRETGTENDLPHRGSPWPLSSHFSSLGSFFSSLPLTNEEGETPWTLMVSHLSS